MQKSNDAQPPGEGELEQELRQIFKDTCHQYSGTPTATMAGWGFGGPIAEVQALIARERREAFKEGADETAELWREAAIAELSALINKPGATHDDIYYAAVERLAQLQQTGNKQ